MTAVDERPADVDWLYADVDPTTLPPIRPAYLHRPACTVGSMAPQLAELAERLGTPADPEQVEVLDVLTGERADGRPAARTAAAVSPRQNVKTWALELYALGKSLRPRPSRRIVWSAHELDTTMASQAHLIELIDEHRWLQRYVAKVMTANGKASITFTTGCEIKFKARSSSGGRGLFGDDVLLDEGFALTKEHMGSLIPIMSTRAHARTVIASSAPMADSEVLHEVMGRGRRGGVGAPAYIEFKAPGSFDKPGCTPERPCGHEEEQPRCEVCRVTRCRHEVGDPGCVLDRLEVIALGNLAVRSGRIGVDHLRDERRLLGPLEYARERAGWPETPESLGHGFTVAAWDALKLQPGEGVRAKRLPVGVGVDVLPASETGIVGVCGERADGRRQVEVLRVIEGLADLVEYLDQLTQDLPVSVRILGGSSTAKVLKPLLEEAGVPFEETTTADYAAACGLLTLDVRRRDLAHLGDLGLQRAVKVLGTVPVGDAGGFRWSPAKSGGDISRVIAVTLARWQMHVDPQPDYDAADSVG